MNTLSSQLTASPMQDILHEIERRAVNAAQQELPQETLGKTITQIYEDERRWVSDIREQIMVSRRYLFWFILVLMGLETVVLFVVLILVALPSKPLTITDGTLQIVTGATIAQISAMLIVIVRSVYSESLNQFIQRH